MIVWHNSYVIEKRENLVLSIKILSAKHNDNLNMAKRDIFANDSWILTDDLITIIA